MHSKRGSVESFVFLGPTGKLLKLGPRFCENERKSCILFTYCRQEDATFHLIFTQPGAHLSDIPCIQNLINLGRTQAGAGRTVEDIIYGWDPPREFACIKMNILVVMRVAQLSLALLLLFCPAAENGLQKWGEKILATHVVKQDPDRLSLFLLCCVTALTVSL